MKNTSAHVPPGAKRIPLRPLALGEVTGHMHAVATQDEHLVEMYELDSRALIRVVGDDVTVRIIHGKDPSNLAPVEPGEDRHGPLLLDPARPTIQRQGDVLLIPVPGFNGIWEARIQTEETPDAVIKSVAD